MESYSLKKHDHMAKIWGRSDPQFLKKKKKNLSNFKIHLESLISKTATISYTCGRNLRNGEILVSTPAFQKKK